MIRPGIRNPVENNDRDGARLMRNAVSTATDSCASKDTHSSVQRAEFVHRALACVTLVVLLLSLDISAATAVESRVPAPTIKAGMGKQCVEPVDIMRRDHMKFLLHQRNDTVRKGIRGAKHSLVGCIGCHATRQTDGSYNEVNAPGEFCADCHRYAAVSLDCFECHATVPGPDSVIADSGAAVRLEHLLNVPGQAFDALRQLFEQGQGAIRDALTK